MVDKSIAQKLPDEVRSFLIEYAKSIWDVFPDNEIDIITKLCNEYYYGGKQDREFLMIAYGWIWGHTKDQVTANCLSAILLLKLNEIYEEVATQNNW